MTRCCEQKHAVSLPCASIASLLNSPTLHEPFYCVSVFYRIMVWICCDCMSRWHVCLPLSIGRSTHADYHPAFSWILASTLTSFFAERYHETWFVLMGWSPTPRNTHNPSLTCQTTTGQVNASPNSAETGAAVDTSRTLSGYLGATMARWRCGVSSRRSPSVSSDRRTATPTQQRPQFQGQAV